MKKWRAEYTIPAPMKQARDGRWNPAFGVISKNNKITVKGRFAVWSKEAKDWGRDFQFLSKQALYGKKVGDADYKIVLQLLVPDRRKRDPHNFTQFILDQLQNVLECDDSRFVTETLANKLVPKNECGFCLIIHRL